MLYRQGDRIFYEIQVHIFVFLEFFINYENDFYTFNILFGYIE